MRKKLFTLFVFAAVVLALSACQIQSGKEAQLQYPVTKKVEQVDDYFGTKVADPYRWLEDGNAEDVKQWIKEENTVTFGFLDRIPFREKIRARMKEIYNYPRYSLPLRAGDYFFFDKNDGLQNQSVIYRQKGLDGQPEVFIDPNTLSPDGTLRIRLISFSTDNRYVALSRAEAGSDWSEIRVMEVATMKELSDRIQWVKFSGASWQGDGFYYSAYDKPAAGRELTAKNEFQRVFYHKLGNAQEKDIFVYEDKEHPLRSFGVDITEDEKYLFLSISQGTHGNELYYKDLAASKMDFQPLIQGFENDTFIIDAVGAKFLLHTNVDAPNYKVVLVDPKTPAKENWQVVIPEKPEVLRSATAAGGQLFCTYLKDANTKVFQYDLKGRLAKEIELPALGTASGFGGKRDEKVLFYSFASFTHPPTIYKYDFDAGRSEVYRQAEVKFNPDDYEVKQVFYQSKDGTRVPMFLVSRKGLPQDGKNPVYLYGYGGFNSSQVPSFNPSRIVLLESGMILAIANLRGGGEYGESWHEAGMLLNKQKVFDDFIAAAEYLIEEKYTSPDYLAIAGGSNGGLLVGAAMTQRPDLFKVALPAVGVMDMLRYHKFTIGESWAVEYGSSDDETNFKNLYSYSPLHNIKDGVCYPATFVTTADHDDRVVPAHSFKFAATLQEKQGCKKPVLIRVETRSGHGASSITKNIDLLTDTFSFMFYNMGVEPK